MEKFPDHIDTALAAAIAASPNGAVSTASPIKQSATYTNGHSLPHHDRWRPGSIRYENGAIPPARMNTGGRASPSSAVGASGPAAGAGNSSGRHRQKSISEAFRTIRTRHGSMSQNAHEIADALRAPVSPRLIVLCVLWYTSSALTNTSSKSILTAFDRPATLTLIQFALVSSYCLMSSWVAGAIPTLRNTVPALKYPIRPPSRQVLATTLPLAAFQIGGHLLSSTATAKIPVSLVHTIKGLSPLFTVLAYRFLYSIHYPTATYLSLIPLTCGVMLACSGNHKFGGELLGVIYALLAALIFVTQNIFSKKLFNEAARAEAEGTGTQSRKLDKLNLLCYSTGLAFVLTLPIWFWSEGIGIIRDVWRDGSVGLSARPDSFDHGRLALEFLFNGTFHFCQNILAFVLLSMVSPVTYSVASLIKRVFVIVIAIIWFQSPTTPVQAIGIALTFLGLYLYDRSNESNKADCKARMMSESGRKAPLLPLRAVVPGPRGSDENGGVLPAGEPYFASPTEENTNTDKKKDDGGVRLGSNPPVWLQRGTKQEDTWLVSDRQAIGV